MRSSPEPICVSSTGVCGVAAHLVYRLAMRPVLYQQANMVSGRLNKEWIATIVRVRKARQAWFKSLEI
ncbi:hypothetical protein Q8A64_03225 [Oxalobacteraceae bacterium R-40]|uniref:Uncharacterized protein n=1 Tax=Keguizhuia sedimenti TaxID=3064264 RepID=A0ABU1BM52_9BURK|nr:hypothetical protein [Oxalobacteraceae bacterium R-40]